MSEELPKWTSQVRRIVSGSQRTPHPSAAAVHSRVRIGENPPIPNPGLKSAAPIMRSVLRSFQLKKASVVTSESSGAPKPSTVAANPLPRRRASLSSIYRHFCSPYARTHAASSLLFRSLAAEPAAVSDCTSVQPLQEMLGIRPMRFKRSGSPRGHFPRWARSTGACHPGNGAAFHFNGKPQQPTRTRVVTAPTVW